MQVLYYPINLGKRLEENDFVEKNTLVHNNNI